jgi:hypothetical protein
MKLPATPRSPFGTESETMRLSDGNVVRDASCAGRTRGGEDMMRGFLQCRDFDRVVERGVQGNGVT